MLEMFYQAMYLYLGTFCSMNTRLIALLLRNLLLMTFRFFFSCPPIKKLCPGFINSEFKSNSVVPQLKMRKEYGSI